MAQQSAVRGGEIGGMLQLQRVSGRFSLVVEALRAVWAAVCSGFAPFALGSPLDTRGTAAGAEQVHPVRRPLAVLARSGSRVFRVCGREAEFCFR